MVTLNLTATTAEQTKIKNYLEINASEVLADKINNGVKIEKDGVTLLNKKSLEGFMSYAFSEAQKLVEKGAKAACIEGDVVFGWAIHFWEEDSIEGTLYHDDGTEYKPKPIVKPKPATVSTYTPPSPRLKQEITFFDIMDEAANEMIEAEQEEADEDWQDGDAEPDEGVEIMPVNQTEPQGLIRVSESEYVDEDGIVYDANEITTNSIPKVLKDIFGNEVVYEA